MAPKPLHSAALTGLLIFLVIDPTYSAPKEKVSTSTSLSGLYFTRGTLLYVPAVLRGPGCQRHQRVKAQTSTLLSLLFAQSAMQLTA